MRQKKSGLSSRGKRTKKNVRYIPDCEIDYSDIPEFTEEQLKQFKPVSEFPWLVKLLKQNSKKRSSLTRS